MNLWKRIFSKKSDKKINDKRQTQVIARRKNLKNLLDKFYNLLQDDKSETIMVEHYLIYTKLILHLKRSIIFLKVQRKTRELRLIFPLLKMLMTKQSICGDRYQVV